MAIIVRQFIDLFFRLNSAKTHQKNSRSKIVNFSYLFYRVGSPAALYSICTTTKTTPSVMLPRPCPD